MEKRTLLVAFSEFVDPNPAPGNWFGTHVVPLSTGNVLVTSPYDDQGGTDAGAVYLFNGTTGALISTLTGSHAYDRIGYGGITTLSNGNFVINSPYWSNGVITQAGAVTWGSGTTGVSGVVSIANSLVGSNNGDQVGSDDFLRPTIQPLPNGNYVVSSPLWDNGATVNAGAVTWGNGTAGTSGLVSEINSLVGNSSYDSIGYYKTNLGGHSTVKVLSNGNYVIASPLWDNGSATDAGAVTWGSGASGISGVISTGNSLVGGSANDNVGYHADNLGDYGVSELSNGNYVVSSPGWDNGSIANVGAVTWGSGTVGITGLVSSANSLVGSSTEDSVGIHGVAILSNGNYVVSSPFWDRGSIVDAGAATWGDGTTGVKGVLSASNSLVGGTANDKVGGYQAHALNNGNYVVLSPSWNKGSAVSVGAVTWGNGATGIKGVVSASNSLIGSTANDLVGSSGVTELSNGNYVVSSHHWNNGVAVHAGAVTWGSGTTGVKGVVSAANSLVGSKSDDLVGNYGVKTLSNGNYVVVSSSWNNGAAINAGAVTWGSGATGVKGVVSAANSLVGTTTEDNVGMGEVLELSNGNYIVRSRYWDNGSAADAGAVTWGSGTTGVKGVVGAANSLVGSSENDLVGNQIELLSNGNYIIDSRNWDNGSAIDAGAFTWASGTAGVSGIVSAANSLVGSSSYDGNGAYSRHLSNGNYVVLNPNWDNGAAINAGAVTWGDGTTGIRGVISTANSLVGSSSDDNLGSGDVKALSNGNYVVYSPNWDNGGVTNTGAVTWGSGTTGIKGSVSAANSLVGSSANDNVGSGGVIELNNGNYLVRSPNWDNGGVINAEAITWGDGVSGISGVVNASNSLVGTSKLGFTAPNFPFTFPSRPIVQDQFNDTYIASFYLDGGGRVRVGSQAGPVTGPETGPVTFTLSGSVLNVLGTSNDDTITVRNVAGIIKIDANGTLINTRLSAASVSAVSISGLAGNDSLKMDSSLGALVAGTLLGGSGNDTLFSGLGNDTLDGGADVDTVSYVQARSGVRVSLASTAFQTTGGAGKDKLLSTENLVGSAFNDSLTGSTGANILRGGAGNDTLTGGAGADFLLGEAGVDRLAIDSLDTLNGGADVDTVTIGAGTGNVYLNLFTSDVEIVSATASMGNHWFNATGVSRAVTITGGAGQDTIIGGQSNDRLTGGSGNDSIVGGGGNDTITGGLGSDSLHGEAGNDYLAIDSLDTVSGGANIDTVYVGAGTGNVNLNLFTGEIENVTATASTGNNTFDATGATWAVRITGGAGNDTILGGNWGDRLTGGSGNDSIVGNSGNDSIVGGEGIDVLLGGAGYDTLYIDSQDSVNGGANIDTVYVGAGTGNVNLNLFTGEIENVTATASTGNNTFDATGATWAVRITGGAGNDTILGGNWGDRLTGGSGNDSIVGNSGNDSIVGGEGIDTVSYSTATGSVSVNLTTKRAIGASGTDTLITIENVTGSPFADTITGDLLNNLLDGGDRILGNDTILGGGGVDSIINA